MHHHFAKNNSIVNKYIAELRDAEIQEDKMRFRTNLERIASIMAYEISKTFQYTTAEVTTPLGISDVEVPDDKVIVASILRAGVPMHNGFLNVLDDVDSAFVSSYRKHHKDGNFEVKLEYVTCPDLDDTVLIIADPMVATGSSVDSAMQALLKHGQPREIHIATVIASTNGMDHLKRKFPNAHIWVGDIDSELTAKSYIVPGLGDAGDLAFGPKVQE
jgi:uracil phosphoribosyltransferase